MAGQVIFDAATPTIGVSDVQKTVEYYRDVLGFEILWLWQDPPKHAAVRRGAAEIHFFRGATKVHNAYVYLKVQEIDALHADLTEKKVPELTPLKSKPWGMKEFDLHDLNGLQLRFAQPV